AIDEDGVLVAMAAHAIAPDEVGDEVPVRLLLEGAVDRLVLVLPEAQQRGGEVEVRLGQEQPRAGEGEAIDGAHALLPAIAAAHREAQLAAAQVLRVHLARDEGEPEARAALALLGVAAA